MQLRCRKSGNSWIVTIPKDMKHPDYVWVYTEEQISDSERLKRLENKYAKL